jgi:hypothetical protein
MALSCRSLPHIRKADFETRTVSASFAGGLRLHYLSMRDDQFVRTLAEELEGLLE